MRMKQSWTGQLSWHLFEFWETLIAGKWLSWWFPLMTLCLAKLFGSVLSVTTVVSWGVYVMKSMLMRMVVVMRKILIIVRKLWAWSWLWCYDHQDGIINDEITQSIFFNCRYTVKEHVETHISGFCHQCPLCSKTCKTRNALRVHTIRKHNQRSTAHSDTVTRVNPQVGICLTV